MEAGPEMAPTLWAPVSDAFGRRLASFCRRGGRIYEWRYLNGRHYEENFIADSLQR
jgi:hypothetical protein